MAINLKISQIGSIHTPHLTNNAHFQYMDTVSRRMQTEAIYQYTVQVVNALAVVGTMADYVPLIDYMNQLIKRYKEQVLHVHASAGGGSSSDGGSGSDSGSGGSSSGGSGGSSSGGSGSGGSSGGGGDTGGMGFE